MRRSARLPLETLAPYLLDLPDPPALLRWDSAFGNTDPVEIEVGSGKGLFLVTQAAAHPRVNYVGIEILRKYQLFIANRVAKRRLANVRVGKADARDFLRAFVPAGSVRALHVYFPDPWWKRRHVKRRLFTPEFVSACERVLVNPGGRLEIATDVSDYFEMILRLLAERTAMTPLPPAGPGAAAHDLDYLTNFERKFRKAGRSVYRATFERRLAQSRPGTPATLAPLEQPQKP